jgi:hypothetical protein
MRTSPSTTALYWKRWHIPFAAALMLVGAMSVRAQLTWEKDVVTVKAEPSAVKANITFSFKNTTDKSITIAGVKPSCGCTTTTLPKYTYAPGESGSLDAAIKIAGKTGLLSKRITVRYKGEGIKATVLTLRVDIPRVITIKKSFIHWMMGDARSSKEVDVRFTYTDPIHITRMTWNKKDLFDAKLVEDEAGKAYKIVITPKNTMVRAYGQLTIFTDYKVKGRPVSKTIRVSIVPPNISNATKKPMNRDFPGMLSISPSVLTWPVRVSPHTKVIRITIDKEATIHITRAFFKAGAKFKSELVEEEPGRKYLIRVTPINTDLKASAILTIETDYLDTDGKLFRTNTLVGIVRPSRSKRYF